MGRKATRKEQQWIDRLREVMNDCPDTLCLATHGYSYLLIWDRELAATARTEELCDGNDQRIQVGEGLIPVSCCVHGISG